MALSQGATVNIDHVDEQTDHVGSDSELDDTSPSSTDSEAGSDASLVRSLRSHLP